MRPKSKPSTIKCGELCVTPLQHEVEQNWQKI